MSKNSISQKAVSRRAGRWALLAFFCIFALVGGGLFFGIFFPSLVNVIDARGWDETPCLMISSHVQSHPDSDGTTYSIEVLYSYTVEGRQYTSNRYEFMGGSSSGYEGKAEVVAQYPPGNQAMCYVNPKDPTEAVLQPGFTLIHLVGLVPLVLFIVGLGGAISTLRKGLAKDPQLHSGPSPMGLTSDALQSIGQARFVDTLGPAPLKPKMSPLMGFLAAIAFSLLWNGIFSILVFQAVESWQSGSPDWAMTVFLIPFVLIGIGSVGVIVYFFLGLFNPRPRLTVSANSVTLGGSIDLEWQMSGQAQRIQRLRVYLEGKEEARYRRGTRSYTDRETFATITFVDTMNSGDMFGGRCRLTVPPDTMHSFAGDNNMVVWTLHLKGDIKRWPDVNEEFEINVLPMKSQMREF
jgi:hypothetical protein